ncbi:Uncharacterized conserved protein (COG2071) [Streptomyces sp. TLI_053]|uniref:DUF2071 domain-containing protein n=1 Tax=Streptomyces sp. TLI_053 TaxID=1855352 RepID=UPI000879E97D|nr:DUF2071 domain-containing protein [Streptomyces sp. TLI_053]SDT79863.1 Uncharacterized conserved protein (COG2071) [Streptomyces sp. TLI_053]
MNIRSTEHSCKEHRGPEQDPGTGPVRPGPAWSPEAAARLLPAPLRPQLVRGHAVAGLCPLRLGRVRPAWAPAPFGLRSENAAHRIAVEWDGPDGVENGVYIPRRDTGSRLNAWAGGRIFPGEHGRADFTVDESADRLRVAFATRDGGLRAEVAVELAAELPASRLFDGLAEASAFFRCGSRGFSPTRDGGVRLDGMELHTDAWRLEACRVESAVSSFFDDPERFPPGSAELDCALVMRDVPVAWAPLTAAAVSA